MKVINFICNNLIELLLLGVFITGAFNDYLTHNHFPYGYVNAMLWLLLATVRKNRIEYLEKILGDSK